MSAYKRGRDYCTAALDKVFGVEFGDQCHIHDHDYSQETEQHEPKQIDRATADKNLRDGIQKKFNDKADFLVLRSFGEVRAMFYRGAGFVVSRAYYGFVRVFGRLFWQGKGSDK